MVDISIVVPTHARISRLERLLDSLQRQCFSAHRVEILVVDDGSPPDPRLDKIFSDTSHRLLRQVRQGPAAARNHGAREAGGALLVFIDDDCVADPGWLEALWQAHEQSPQALLGGSTINGLPDNPFSAAAESLMHFFDEDDRRRGLPPRFFASNNLACARSGFLAVGGFDMHYTLAAGEDRDFCRRWFECGQPLKRVGAARVRHCHEHSLKSFWRQQHNYGRGAAIFHDGRSVKGLLPRNVGFYAGLLIHPLGRKDWSWFQRLRALPILVVSQMAIFLGLRRQRRRRHEINFR